MGNFVDIDHADLRQAIATRAYSKGGIAIDAAPADVETVAAVDYSINGVMYQLAIQAAIDVSAAGVLTESGATAALTAQAIGTDRIYLLVLNAAAVIKVVQGVAVPTGETCYCPRVPPGHCAFAAVKVANASAGAFTFGTTSLATAGVTDTFFDLTIAPETL